MFIWIILWFYIRILCHFSTLRWHVMTSWNETFSALLSFCEGKPPVDSPYKTQHRDAELWCFCAWTNGWGNNRDAVNFRCHRAHYNVTVKTDISNHCSQEAQFRSSYIIDQHNQSININPADHLTLQGGMAASAMIITKSMALALLQKH